MRVGGGCLNTTECRNGKTEKDSARERERAV